jgi:hypothetical protein
LYANVSRENSLVAAAGAGNTDTAETLSVNLYSHEATNAHSVSQHAAHEDCEPVTAKALDFAVAVVGHELGAVERQQAMAT